MPSNAQRCKAMPSNAKQCHAMPINVKQCKAMSSNAKQYQVMPSNVFPCLLNYLLRDSPPNWARAGCVCAHLVVYWSFEWPVWESGGPRRNWVWYSTKPPGDPATELRDRCSDRHRTEDGGPCSTLESSLLDRCLLLQRRGVRHALVERLRQRQEALGTTRPGMP